MLKAGWVLVMYQTMLIPKPRVEKTLYSKICSEDYPSSAPRSNQEREGSSRQKTQETGDPVHFFFIRPRRKIATGCGIRVGS